MNVSPSKTKTLEADMKAAALNYLKDKGALSKFSTVINELTLDKFSRRVDLAIIEEGRSYAIEIKSEADSLHRLDGQTQKYLEYFDKVIIVSAPRHVERILDTVPKHVAVWELGDKGITIKQRGKIAPVSSPSKFIDLMKVNELYKLITKLKINSSSRSRRSLEVALASAPLKALREFCLKCVQERYRETSELFWQNIDRGEILPEDILLLSRSRPHREREEAHKRNQLSLWNSLKRLDDPYLEATDISFGTMPENIRELIAA